MEGDALDVEELDRKIDPVSVDVKRSGRNRERRCSDDVDGAMSNKAFPPPVHDHSLVW